MGIGGSATNDGGMGMARALGVRFLDEGDHELEGVGASLAAIRKIDVSGLDPRVTKTRFAVVCDVDNPLTGPRRAAHVFGPQKGATPEQVLQLDAGLANLADVIERDLGVSVRDLPGSGAAGGLGAGLHASLNAELRKGIDVVLGLFGLEQKIRGADLVLTGEGQIDFQTVFDKAPAGVGRAALAQGIPCFAIAGPMTLDDAMRNAAVHIARATEQAVRAFVSRS